MGGHDLLAERAKAMEASKTILIAARAAELRRQGVDVVSLSVGEPDFETPQHIKDACTQALAEGFTHYTASPGIPELREAIAAKLRKDNEIPAQAENVVAIPTKHALFATALAFLEPGDEVLLPDPCFVSYAPVVRFAGAKPVWVPTTPEQGFSIQADEVASRVGPKTKMVWLCSPGNPTGGVDAPDEVRGVAQLAQDHDFLILSDEIYERLQFDGQPYSAASEAFDRTITVGGLSKSHAMTGWRAGWAAADGPLIDPILKIQSQSITHVASFVQKAMLAALQGPQTEVDRMRSELAKRREAACKRLHDQGILVTPPKGAFYLWLRHEAGRTSQEVAQALLDQHRVAVVPGEAFGPSGDAYLRLSFGIGGKELEKGLDRVAQGLAGLRAPTKAAKA